MSQLPDPIPNTVPELQALVREQAAQLAKLTTDKDTLLSRVERNEETVNNALQLHLSHVHQEKAKLEESLASLSENQVERGAQFERQLKELRVRNDETPPTEENYQETIDSDNVANIKALAALLKERVDTQEALIKKLKFELEMECGHVNILRADNQALRQLTVNLQASAEQEEEFISNKLLKRINSLKKEKSELLLKVEQEEEAITSTLQKKLRQLQKEKVDMEIALEQEQEFIVNRLQKQLESLRQQQGLTSPALGPVKKWPPSHSPSSSMSMIDLTPISPGVLEMLKAEVNSLKQKLADTEKEYEEGANTCRELYFKLREEVVRLRQQVGMSVEDVEKLYPVVLPVALGNGRGVERKGSVRGGPGYSRRSASESDPGSGFVTPGDTVGIARPDGLIA